MSQYFIPIKPSAARRLPQKEFKLPVEESIKIIDEVRKFQKYTKTIRPDQNRKEYQNLLQWANTSLQSTRETVKSTATSYKEYSEQQLEEQTIDEEMQMQQRRIIQTLMIQMIEMFKRQCKQKSQLMQIINEFFNQTINMYSKHYERQYLDTLKNYNIELQEIQGDYQLKLNQCNKRISYLESQKQTKWKNIYMLAKDNRILRRQKGKLMRMIQEQDQKIRLLETQLCQVVKENETNKLIIRFESDHENLKIFMKNRLALMKFQKIIENFPKKAMKVLNNDLLKLEIEELNSLDSKIDYIKRVITESGDIFDEYEDLNQLMSRPNKMVFNVYTQTDVDDINPPKQYRQFGTGYDIQIKWGRLESWDKIYDIKMLGWPQMKQKYVHMRNPNKMYSIKPISSSGSISRNQTNRIRQYILLQISSGQVNQWIDIKINRNSDNFNRVINTGVTYNPDLKDKTKLYFVMPYVNYESRFVSNDVDQIFKSTLPIGTKKQKQAYIRKSQSTNQKPFALSSVNTTKSPKKQRNSQAQTLQKNFSSSGRQADFQFLAPPQIDQRTQLDSSVITEEKNDKEDSFPQSQGQQLFEINLQKMKKKRKRKSFRRGTELAPFLVDKGDSPTQKMSIFKQEKLNGQSSSTSRFSYNIDTHSELMKNQKNIASNLNNNGSITQRNNNKSTVPLNKSNRIKTTQNFRSSYIENNKLTMDQIFQQPDQNNQDTKKFKPYESLNKTSRMSYGISPKTPTKFKQRQSIVNITNLSGINPNENNLNGWEEENEGRFAERSQKYHATFFASNSNALNRKISKFAIRNSSFNSNNIIMKQPQYHRQSTKNMDTYSIKSRISSQSPSTFNHKMYLSGMAPKKSLQILSSQVMNPVAIKNFEVKKLTQKIIRNMYIRRKQLLSSQTSTSLKVFTEHCLKQIYGNNWKGEKNLLRHSFSVEDRESSSSIIIFTLLLNGNVHIEYLEDLFRLYVTMLDKNEFSNSDNPLLTSKSKGSAILKYLLSVYFDEATAKDIQQNLPFMNQYEIDLNEIFIVVQTHVRKYTIETQMYAFLKMILPENQSFIDFGQMKQLMYFFKNQLSYHAHMARLKYFFKTYGKIVSQQQQALAVKAQPSKSARLSNTGDFHTSKSRNQPKQTPPKQDPKQNIQILPVHRVCLYLKRFQWTEMIELNSTIEEKYHKLVGVFIQQESIKFITRYYAVIQERLAKKKTFFQGGLININVTINQQSANNQHQALHPLTWLISRTKQIIRNYYRYKGSMDRHLLMFVHMSILNYELDVAMSEVFSEHFGSINLEYKKLKTKEEVDLFMKD